MLIVPMMCVNHELFSEQGHTHDYKIYQKKRLAVFCANCGGYGHVYKTCNHPIISYGIICYKLFYDQHTNSIYPRYLMVQRKDSLCYVEFIRGKYSLNNKAYIMKLFSNMTGKERSKIYSSSFDSLWNEMWCRGNSKDEHNTRNFNKECKESNEKFDRLKEGYAIKSEDGNTSYINMEMLLNSTEPIYSETEWGFPKGRRNINEDDVSCAIREFREETGIAIKDIRINKDIKPLEEVFTGSNNIRYKHVYYIARYYNTQYTSKQSRPQLYDPDNCVQTKEVKDVQWFTYQEAQDRIRCCNIERKELFKRLNQMIIKTCHLQ